MTSPNVKRSITLTQLLSENLMSIFSQMTIGHARSSWTCLLMSTSDVLWLPVFNNVASDLMRTGPMFV